MVRKKPSKAKRKRHNKTLHKKRKRLIRKLDLKREADRLFSLFIRGRDKVCRAVMSGSPCFGGLQCAHIVSRRYLATRWGSFLHGGDVPYDNAIAMCAKHHMSFTFDNDKWFRWVDSNIGINDYRRLQSLANVVTKVTPQDYAEMVDRLSNVV